MTKFTELTGPGGKRFLVKTENIEAVGGAEQDAKGRFWVHFTTTSGQEYVQQFGSAKAASNFVESIIQ